MNDVEQILVSVVSSGAIAACITAYINHRAELRRNRREDYALRRHVSAAARSLRGRVRMARQFGFTNTESLSASIAYLQEIAKSRDVEKALSDKASRYLHDSIELCHTFIKFSKNMKIDPESTLSNISPEERERKIDQFSRAAKPTFDKLREFFYEVDAHDVVAEFDEAEQARLKLERIRAGLE